jgi:hypothetical protein
MRSAALLLLAIVMLSACGSSGRVIPRAAANVPLAESFARLHALGLRVEVRFGRSNRLNVSSLRAPIVERLSPPAGAHVKAGGIVKITAAAGVIGSPVVLKSNPHVQVPNFVGGRTAVALNWADRHGMYWAIPAIPPLPPSRASRLFDAYRVVAQRPKPGAVLGQGQLTRSGGYRVTPLILIVRPR